MHSVQMGPNQRVIRGANADTVSSTNDHLIRNGMRLVLEAASLQKMEGKKELHMWTPRPLKTFVTCMESPELPVAMDD